MDDLLCEADSIRTTGALFAWLHERKLTRYRVVPMDEYTIDIVVLVARDLVLVFDTT